MQLPTHPSAQQPGFWVSRSEPVSSRLQYGSVQPDPVPWSSPGEEAQCLPGEPPVQVNENKNKSKEKRNRRKERKKEEKRILVLQC